MFVRSSRMQDADALLVLRATRRDMAFRAAPVVGGLLLAIFLGVVGWSQAGIGDRIWYGFCVALALAFLPSILRPPTLVADRGGIRWSSGWRRRTYPWADIEEIGVARWRDADVLNTPVWRRTFRGRPVHKTPLVGLNLIPERGSPDAATRAYRRGYIGYDVGFPNPSSRLTEEVVDELRVRLERARAAVRPPASSSG
jgi:hypothetical protein